MPQAVIFDCDGVLVDSRAATMFFYNQILAGLGLPPVRAEQERALFSLTVEDSFRLLMPEECLEKARALLAAFDPDDFRDRVRAMPGVMEVLELLERAGIGLAVNTNADSYTQGTLERLGLLGFFNKIVTCEDVGNPKPDPEGVRIILAHFGLDAGQVVYIGDSEIDRLTARAAGVRFWSYDNPELDAERDVTDYPVLLREFGRWFKSKGRMI